MSAPAKIIDPVKLGFEAGAFDSAKLEAIDAPQFSDHKYETYKLPTKEVPEPLPKPFLEYKIKEYPEYFSKAHIKEIPMKFIRNYHARYFGAQPRVTPLFHLFGLVFASGYLIEAAHHAGH